MTKIVIAIDGHSATGKSSTAKKVAEYLGYIYLDSGAMYRATTLYFLRNNIKITDNLAVDKALRKIVIEFKYNDYGLPSTYLNGEYVEDEIRSMAISGKVSEVSALKAVRISMVDRQQLLGSNKGIVMDGRDIGSVVFPDAELKIFMTATEKIRAQRRQKELSQNGESISFEEVLENIIERDEKDSTRKESPLLKVKDALEVDNSEMTFDDQVQKIINLAESKIAELV